MRISDWSSDVCSSDLSALFKVACGHLRACERVHSIHGSQPVGAFLDQNGDLLIHEAHPLCRRVSGVCDEPARLNRRRCCLDPDEPLAEKARQDANAPAGAARGGLGGERAEADVWLTSGDPKKAPRWR